MPNIVYALGFLKAADRLKKRYPHVIDDTEALADQLEAGQLPGKRLQGLPYQVYKTRIKNSDVQKGKSGGYRVMYYLETSEKLVLLIIFTKSDESNLPTDVIRRLIEEYRRRG